MARRSACRHSISDRGRRPLGSSLHAASSMSRLVPWHFGVPCCCGYDGTAVRLVSVLRPIRILRFACLTLLAATSAATGLWFGEDLDAPFPSMAALVAAVAISGTFGLALRQPVWLRIGASLGIVVLFGGGWSIGDRERSQAYNECRNSGDSVLAALRAYRTTNGEFPASLSVLSIRIPCQRTLRGTILEYSSQKYAFTLSFGDWLMSNSANQDSSTFQVHK